MNNMFEKVKCKGYLKREKLLKYIHIDNSTITAYAIDPKMPEKEGMHELEDDESFINTYFSYVEKQFTGFIVGYKNVILQKEIYAEWHDPIDVGVGIIPAGYRINTAVVKKTKCAIVYYASNRKRLVPVDKIEAEN